MKPFKFRVGAVVFFCLIIFSGCYTKENVKNISDEEILKERGSVYWEYLCKGEFDKAYELEYPVYRKTVSLTNYIRRFSPNIKWKNAVIGKVEIKDEVALMTVVVDTEMRMTVPKTPAKIDIEPQLQMEEKWIKMEGAWYHVPNQFREADKKI
jgi:hypothetical protein